MDANELFDETPTATEAQNAVDAANGDHDEPAVTEPEDSETDLPEVDAPTAGAHEATEQAPDGGNAPDAKATKNKRPPVPEGFITPVAFAKELTKHLIETGQLEAGGEIPPQMVYSYLKSNQKGDNAFPQYDGGEGRKVLLKLDEALAWWDAKNKRVAERKANAANKAAKAAEKSTETAPTAATTEAAPVEAE
jgi:hypothetical protein